MTKEGEGVMEELHDSCPSKECNGKIVFVEVFAGVGYYKCTLCHKEYRRARGTYTRRKN
jgi:hypothetical protein